MDAMVLFVEQSKEYILLVSALILSFGMEYRAGNLCHPVMSVGETVMGRSPSGEV